MKIIHVIFGLEIGGAETMLVDLMNEQSRYNEVKLIIINDVYNNYLLSTVEKKIEIIKLKRNPSSKNPIPLFRLNCIIKKIKPSIIHIHNQSIARLLFVHTPVCLTAHCLGIQFVTSCKKIKRVFAISNAVKNDLEKRYPRKFNIFVIPNGINMKIIRQRTNTNRGPIFRIVQVARLDITTKGQDILIRSAALLKKYGINNFHIDFIGEGADLNALEQLVRKYQLESYISFLGLKEKAYIYENLCEYDLLCHPSRHEGFGLTVAEGIAAKIPVLVSNCGGPFEIISSGKYGYFFKNESYEDLAMQLKKLIKQENLAYFELVDKAYEHVLNNYTITRMANEYAYQYSKI